MIHPDLFLHTFQEELYVTPARTVVALPNPWNEIRESEKLLLDKILGLAQLSLNHVKVVVTSKPDVVKWEERPSRVIAFGLDAPGLSQNEVLEIQGIKLIVTSGLAELENADKGTKKKLAEALKVLVA